MKLYGVVNMDIVGSRKIKDRQQFQTKLNQTISRMNEKYHNILLCPAAITLGDEWQLITGRPSESYNLVHEFQQFLWEDHLDLYAGIGIGELSTPVFDDLRKMDGPCFHNAREAINIAKNVNKLKNNYNINKLNRVFFLTGQIPYDRLDFNILNFFYMSKSRYNDSAKQTMQEIAATIEKNIKRNAGDILIRKILLEKAINLIIENNEILKAKMTKKQKEIYISYFRLGSYRKIIRSGTGSCKETTGGISQKLNNASYFTIQRNHSMVSELIEYTCSTGA